MTYTLRDYQLTAVEAAFNFICLSTANGYVTAPGGSGKSVKIAALAERLLANGYQVVILARSEKLLTQNRAKLSDPSQAGIYCAGLGERDLSKPIIIASVQSIAGQIIPRIFGKQLIVLVDECDEIHPDSESETQYWQFFRANGSPRIIGFTATPFRTATGKIQWGEEIINIPLAPLIARNFLCAPVNKVGAEIDLSPVGISMGEYNARDLELIYDDPKLLRKSVEKILDYSETRNRPLIFTQSLKHADAVANALEWAGQSVMVVSGDTPKDELNDVILPAHEAGEFKHLINCQLLTVGFDMPWIDMVALLMATKSKRRFEQAVYRGTRLYEGKRDFLLLDMGNNLMEHGALGSPYRGQAGRREAATTHGKICPQCETWVEKRNAQECIDCGFIFPQAEPPKVNHSYYADNQSDTVYGGPIAPELMDYEVTGLSAAIKKSKKGNDMIVISYDCPAALYGSIREYLIPHHASDFVRGKAHSVFKKLGDDIYGELTGYAMEDLLWRAQNNLKAPSKITVKHGEFDEVKKHHFYKPEAAQTLMQIEEFLDDEILF